MFAVCFGYGFDWDLVGDYREGTEENERLSVGWLEDLEENDSCYHHCADYELCKRCWLCAGCCSGHHDVVVDDPVSEW